MSEAVEKAVHESNDESALLGVWQAFGSRMTWQKVIERGGDAQVAERALSELPEVSAVDALEANRQLVEFLIGRRWFVMQAAREAGASWSEIGAALGMSKQGAQDWYRRKIAEQERYVGDLHDAERARQALASDARTVEVWNCTSCGAEVEWSQRAEHIRLHSA